VPRASARTLVLHLRPIAAIPFPRVAQLNGRLAAEENQPRTNTVVGNGVNCSSARPDVLHLRPRLAVPHPRVAEKRVAVPGPAKQHGPLPARVVRDRVPVAGARPDVLSLRPKQRHIRLPGREPPFSRSDRSRARNACRRGVDRPGRPGRTASSSTAHTNRPVTERTASSVFRYSRLSPVSGAALDGACDPVRRSHEAV
jgi:hypothetical protein